MNNRIKVHIDSTNPRKEYIVRHLIENIMGCECDMSAISETMADEPLINYSRHRVEGAFNIMPCGLTDDMSLIVHRPEGIGSWHGMPVIFTAEGGDIPFDIFSASFFLLTRMEEYGSRDTDVHGRFKAEASTVFANGFLQRPLIDEWCMQLFDMLCERWPALTCRTRERKFVSTIDIDHPFKYRNKGLVINAAGLVRDMAKRRFREVPERLAVVCRLKPDPYFCFEYIESTYMANGCTPIFFVHTGDKGRYDRKYIYPSRRYNKALRSLCSEFFMGLHPSYRASFDAGLISREKERLESIIGESIVRARFHYLRMQLPLSYRILEETGIRHDYTMMYSSQIGFRASTSVPYRFFDAEQGRELDVTVHPSCVMDVTLKNSCRMDSRHALDAIRSLHYATERCGGEFITLFHNSSLGEDCEWKGWRKTFEDMFTYL